MRACADGDLGLPYLTWIDPNVPLSDKVELIPRVITPGHNFLGFVSALVSFGSMGAFLAYFAWRWHEAGAGLTMPLLMTLIAVGIWAVPWVLGRRWLRSLSAASQQRRGQLRQGILLGAEGLLVRLEPNSCYAVAWDRYLGAKRFHRGAGSALLQVETLDGPVNFPSHWLRTTLPGLEMAVERYRPVTGRPEVIPQGERQRRTDGGPQRRLLRLVLVFAAGGACVLASLAGVTTTEDKTPVHGWAALGVLVGLLWTLGTVPYAFWTLYRLSAYDCPECGKRLPRADEFRPNVVFYCATCGINWDTQMSERRMPHGPS